MYKRRDMLYIVFFLAFVLLLWVGIFLIPAPGYETLPSGGPGCSDLTGLDFSDTLYRIHPDWVAWPEALLTPEELAGQEAASVLYYDVDRSQVQYATYRLELMLRPGVTYGMVMRSSSYAMRLFVDGVESVTAGNPAASKEDNVPRVRDVVYYFTPWQDSVELVVQSSNYVHSGDGTTVPGIYIGTAESVSRHVRNRDLRSGLIFGCLALTGLYHLAIFLLNRRQRASLIFAVLCSMMALVSGDFASLLFPSYNWQAYTRMEYSLYILAAVALLLLADTLFPGTVGRKVFWGYIVLSGAYIAMILLTDTLFFTYILPGFQAVSVAVIVYSLIKLAKTLREKKLKNTMAFLGIALFCLCIICDILYRNGLLGFLGYNLGQLVNSTMGVVLLVCCYIIVLAVEQAQINQLLEESRTALASAETRFLALYEEKQKGGGKEAGQITLSDFSLTRRETEVTLLLLDGKSRDEIARLLSISMGTVNTHCSSIYRKAECSSVNELMGKIRFREEAMEKPE